MKKNILYYVYNDPHNRYLYLCAKSRSEAIDIARMVLGINGSCMPQVIRAITYREDKHTHTVFKEYFNNRRGYADTLELLYTAVDIHTLPFIHYLNRKERIDLFLSNA